jgi:hypothetical protein
MHETHPNYTGRYMELFRILQSDAWNSFKLYRAMYLNSSKLYTAMHGTNSNYTGRYMELVRIIQGDAWNSSELYRVMHEL